MTSQRDLHNSTLERLTLCTLTIQQTHAELDAPSDPERKADLLLAVEGLTYEVLDLLKTTKSLVWGLDEAETPEDTDNED